MQVVSASQFRTKIPRFIAQAKKTRQPIIITTQKDTGVLISLDHWNMIQEQEDEHLRLLIEEGIKSGPATPWEGMHTVIAEAKLRKKQL